jgi:hypothetical protein
MCDEPQGWSIRREGLVRDRYLATQRHNEVALQRAAVGASLKASTDEAAWLLKPVFEVEQRVCLCVAREDRLCEMGEGLETLKIKLSAQAQACAAIANKERNFERNVRCMHDRMGDMVRHVQGMRAVV